VVESVTGQGERTGKGYGNYIIVQDANGNRYRYSHLSQNLVPIGSQVSPGQVLGRAGNTGAAYSVSGGTGSHLDFRAQNASGSYIDPNLVVEMWNRMTG